jgi:hypothetical protein
MKRKFKQWWSTIPPISTKRKIFAYTLLTVHEIQLTQRPSMLYKLVSEPIVCYWTMKYIYIKVLLTIFTLISQPSVCTNAGIVLWHTKRVSIFTVTQCCNSNRISTFLVLHNKFILWQIKRINPFLYKLIK